MQKCGAKVVFLCEVCNYLEPFLHRKAIFNGSALGYVKFISLFCITLCPIWQIKVRKTKK